MMMSISGYELIIHEPDRHDFLVLLAQCLGQHHQHCPNSTSKVLSFKAKFCVASGPEVSASNSVSLLPRFVRDALVTLLCLLWKSTAHRLILGMVSVVCVLVKICVSSISLYKLDATAPFESAHQFTLVCTVSDSKTVSGCHYNLCSNHSFVLTELFRAVFSLPGHSLPLLYTDLCLLRPWSRAFFFV